MSIASGQSGVYVINAARQQRHKSGGAGVSRKPAAARTTMPSVKIPSASRKPRTKSKPADDSCWRRVWLEKNTKMLLTAEMLSRKQGRVALQSGMCPPTIARRWIDGTGGPGKRKWPYRHVRRTDRDIFRWYRETVERKHVYLTAPLNNRTLDKISQKIEKRNRDVQPTWITI